MKKIILSIIILLSLVPCAISTNLIILDGEMTNTSPSPGGSYYECWLNTCPEDNSMIVTNVNPYSSNYCVLWKCSSNGSAGAFIRDPSYNGINITNMLGFEFWARGQSGNESCDLQFFSYDGNTNHNAAVLSLTSLSTLWTKYSFSKSDILNGADLGFSLEDFIGIKFSGALGGTYIYFDNMVVSFKTNPQSLFQLIQKPMGAGQGLFNGDMEFGDIDNDGDLDLVISGTGSIANRFLIFRNDNSVYNLVQEPLGSNLFSSLAFGDIDNDGDLDLAAVDNKFYILRNNSGTFDIHQMPMPTDGLSASSVAFGDIDNDGDLDLAVTGVDNSINFRCIIYTNQSGLFWYYHEPMGMLQGLANSSIAFADYDNDKDLDLAVTGWDGANCRFIIFQNHNNIFIPALEPMSANQGVRYSCIAFGDYDNDKDLDLAVTGEDNAANMRFIIYRNDNGTFNLDQEPMGVNQGVKKSSIAFGDYDNDGDLDIALYGLDSSGIGRFIIFSNNSGIFNLAEEPMGSNINIYDGSIAFGDIDNDGSLDLAVAGGPTAKRFCIYKNNTSIPNNAPSIPTGFTNINVGGYWRFQWNASSDDNTESSVLRYKIAIGTNFSGKYDYSSEAIHYPRGQANPGNVCKPFVCFYQSSIPASKTVYWKICAFDSALKQSSYSAEQITCSIIPYTPIILSITPLFTNQMAVTWKDVSNETGYTLFWSLSKDTNTANPIVGLPVNITNYTNTGIHFGQVNYYWVKAYNANGSSGFSSVISNNIFKYYYVSKNNPTPLSPYVTPETAATNIEQAAKAASPGSIVLIIDNSTYGPIDVFAYHSSPYYAGVTFAGHPTNNPVIEGGGTPALRMRYEEDNIWDNIHFKSMGAQIIELGSSMDGGADGNYGFQIFRNCKFSGSPSTLVFENDNETTNVSFLFCTFSNLNPSSAILQMKGSQSPQRIIGNKIINCAHNDFITTTLTPGTRNVILSGNLIVNNQGGAVGIPTGDVVWNNTVYNVHADGIDTSWGKTNNISVNNTGFGYNNGTGDYNCGWDNANGNFSGTYNAGSHDINNLDPLFVSPTTFDFRLLPNSPCYNTGKPNGNIQGCMGYHTIGVKMENQNINEVSTYTLTYIPRMDIPVNSAIMITFPLGFNVSGVNNPITTSDWGGGNPAFSINKVQGQTIVILRTMGNTAPAWKVQNLIIPGIINSSIPSSRYSVSFSVIKNKYELVGGYIDYPQDSNCFEIKKAPVSKTNIAPTITIVEPDGKKDTAISNYTINWIDSDPDNDAIISLYFYSESGFMGFLGKESGNMKFLIKKNISEDSSKDRYLWDCSKVDKGEYYIYAKIEDGVNLPGYTWNGPVKIINKPPKYDYPRLDIDDDVKKPDEDKEFNIGINLNKTEKVTIEVYDVQDNLIHTIVREMQMDRGYHNIRWRVKGSVGSGIYWVVMKGEDWISRKRVAIIR